MKNTHDAEFEFLVPAGENKSGFTQEHLELPDFYRKALREQSVVTKGDVKFKVTAVESYCDNVYERFTVYIDLQWFGKPAVE